MSKITSAAVIVETGLIIWAGYVFYRWHAVSTEPTTPFSDLIPYWGSFESVVAPWIAAALFIPVCALALAVARRLGKRTNSN